MKISFSCKKCGSQFTVGEQLAGQAAHCKKCGQRFTIPSASEHDGARRETVDAANKRQMTVASMAVSAREKPVDRRAGGQFASAPRPGAAGRVAGPVSWRDAVVSQIALKPISVDRMPSLRRAKQIQAEEEEDSSPYHLAKPVAPAERPKQTKKAPGVVKASYRDSFKNLGKVLRWINETAYGISILFLMLACVGFATQVYNRLDAPASDSSQMPNAMQAQMQAQMTGQLPPPREAPPVRQNRMTTIGIAGIVVLNVVRLIAGLANLVIIPFRKSPLNGVLFLIPPWTFLYIRKHWNQLEKPVKRVIGPIVTLVLVVVAYAFVPGLSQASRATGTARERLRGASDVLKRDVKGQVDEARIEAKSLQRDVQNKLPQEVEKAQKAAEGLQDRARKTVEEIRTPKTNTPEKSQ